MNGFLPMTREEMDARGWDRPDFVYVLGDAYVDHPSFGPAIISRVLEKNGYKVCIVSQPDWRNGQDIMRFGRPRLGFLVCPGNMDSMVNHYTVAKKTPRFRRVHPRRSGGQKARLRLHRVLQLYPQLL